MSEVVIQVENISKLYHLGAIGTGSFKKDLQRWWNISIMKKDDPFFRMQMIQKILRIQHTPKQKKNLLKKRLAEPTFGH
ncbi:hypothetical protein [Spirosoma sp. KNUC1025]|uniref:hypothetical protein n=1 Tax=Spirosoma sp. KNUC1025 TaxID=2894082 RepID=UPI003869D2FD|nr:hypothetical protein LN737_22225 [Spirosoma sp. KNUC1025]